MPIMWTWYSCSVVLIFFLTNLETHALKRWKNKRVMCLFISTIYERNARLICVGKMKLKPADKLLV